MTFTDKHIVDAYASLFEGLNPLSKLELIERLTKSLKSQQKAKEQKFYKAFGAFGSDESPEAIISDIKSNRHFRNKNENSR